MTFHGEGLTRAMGSRLAPGAFLFLGSGNQIRPKANTTNEDHSTIIFRFTKTSSPNFKPLADVLRGLVVRGKKNPLHFGLPTRLRLALKDAGLTRTGLAQRAGVSHPVVSSLDAGHSLTTVSTLVRLAMALGVSAGWLAFGMGERLAPTPAPAADGMAERLRTIRMLRGHSRMELARMAQISAGTVSYIEQGGQAKVNTVEVLAVALAVSPAWLAFGTEPQLFIPTRRGRPPAPSAPHAG